MWKKSGMGSRNVVRALNSLCGYVLESVSLLEKCVSSPMTYYNWQERDVLMETFLIIVFGVNIVKNLFRVMKLQTTENTKEYVKETVEKYEWTLLVDECQSVSSYQKICHKMFLDDKYSFGRIYVLKIFTQKVGERYPHISDQIQSTYFNKYLDRESDIIY